MRLNLPADSSCKNEESAFSETNLLSLSLMRQNRNNKSSGSNNSCGSFLSRHRTDARVALQQSPILQSDMDKIMEMNYNGKRELKSLRPFTQLDEQTRRLPDSHFAQNAQVFFRLSQKAHYFPSKCAQNDITFLHFYTTFLNISSFFQSACANHSNPTPVICPKTPIPPKPPIGKSPKKYRTPEYPESQPAQLDIFNCAAAIIL